MALLSVVRSLDCNGKVENRCGDLNKVSPHANLFRLPLLKLVTPDVQMALLSVVRSLDCDGKVEQWCGDLNKVSQHANLFWLPLL